MKLLNVILAVLRRNADPVACACKVFNKQIVALSAHIETQRNAVEKSAIQIAKEQERIDVALAEQARADRIKRNIENIIGETA